MSNAANQDAGPDFSLFKNIPPGFAGTIIDWSMGSREITATIIDLILRNHLSVIDTKIIVNTRKYPTKNFEKKFINTIFGENEYVNFKQLSTIVYKKEFDTLLKILADGMIEEGFINKNFQDKMADVAKELIEKIPFGMFNKMKELSKELPDKNTRAIIIPGWAWKAICIFLGVLLCISFIIPHIGALLFPLWFVLIPFAIFTWYINSKIKKKLDPSYDWVLTETGKKAKNDCVHLKKYMEKFPLFEDRLANELVSFAIAFGLGKTWMNKIGNFNAELKLFVESLDYEWNTIYKFMDFDRYLNSIFKE